MKLKLDQQALQEMALEYVDKVLFAACSLCLLWYLYQFVVRPQYNRRPDELDSAAATAKGNIDRTNPKDVVPTSVEYYAKAQRGWVADVNGYEMKTLWRWPLFPELKRRSLPTTYPVRELAARSDVGAITVRNGASGQRWVVLTGLIPLAEQLQAYRAAAGDIPMAERDRPDYRGFKIQRAEIAPAAPPATPLEWKDVDVALAMKFLREDVTAAGSELAPENLLVKFNGMGYPMAVPLPARSDHAWGDEVVHPPAIPLASQVTAPASEGPRPGTKPSESKADEFGGPATPATPATPAAAPERPANAAKDKEDPKFVLFRFFDFTVEPGKHYRYRVMLALANPCQGLEPRRVRDPQFTVDRYLFTDWSPPSDMVSVPNDNRLLLLAVKPAQRLGEEPAAKVLAVKWDPQSGKQDKQIFDNGRRGQWTHLKVEQPAEVINLDKGAAKPSRGAGPIYESDSLLLDLRGGGHFPGHDPSATEPGEIIVLDREGNVVVRNELRDSLEADKLNEAPPSEAATPGGPTVVPIVTPNGVEKPGGSPLFDDAPKSKRPGSKPATRPASKRNLPAN